MSTKQFTKRLPSLLFRTASPKSIPHIRTMASAATQLASSSGGGSSLASDPSSQQFADPTPSLSPSDFQTLLDVGKNNVTPGIGRVSNDLIIERGKGSWVWTHDGRKWLDFTSGIVSPQSVCLSIPGLHAGIAPRPR